MVANSGPVPEWNDRGLLPPYVEDRTIPNSRSPYQISLIDMMLRFGDTAARRQILTGFLDFRAALHTAGIVQGFQWVNGSFVENVIQKEGREPRDIDVVTFFHLPDDYTQETFSLEFPSLFDHRANKAKYHTDGYFVALDTGDIRYLSRRIAYWNSLWSHTREGVWKGYLEIDLSAVEDGAARRALSLAGNEEAAQ